MVDPDRDPLDPDSAAHDDLVALLAQTATNSFPSGGVFDGILTSENRAVVVALAAIGLILDKRLAMSERQRG